MSLCIYQEMTLFLCKTVLVRLTLQGVAKLNKGSLSSDLPSFSKVATELWGDVVHAYSHNGSLVEKQSVWLSRGCGVGRRVQRVERTTPVVLLTYLLQHLVPTAIKTSSVKTRHVITISITLLQTTYFALGFVRDWPRVDLRGLWTMLQELLGSLHCWGEAYHTAGLWCWFERGWGGRCMAGRNLHDSSSRESHNILVNIEHWMENIEQDYWLESIVPEHWTEIVDTQPTLLYSTFVDTQPPLLYSALPTLLYVAQLRSMLLNFLS